MFLLISQAIIIRIPSLASSLTPDSLKIALKNIKELKKITKNRSKLVMSINQSITFSVNFKIGRQIAVGLGFDYDGGTPLPISKVNPPPPPSG